MSGYTTYFIRPMQIAQKQAQEAAEAAEAAAAGDSFQSADVLSMDQAE